MSLSIAEVWHNIKKDNTEKTAEEIESEGEKQLLISFFVFFFGQETHFLCFTETKRLQIISRERFYSSFFFCPGDSRISEE